MYFGGLSLISSILAMAFVKNGVPVTSGPERLGSGVDKLTIHHNQRDVDIYIVYPPGLSAIKVPGDPLVVNLSDNPVSGGRVIPESKLDILLSRVGMNTASLKVLAKYYVRSIIPRGNPLKYAKEIINEKKGVLSFILPMMYPYLIYSLSYTRVKKGLFSKKKILVTGRTVIDLLSFSYCYYNKKFWCDEPIRDVPSDDDLGILNKIYPYERRIITPEGFARSMKLSIDDAEKILGRLESLGFAQRRGLRAFYITPVYPPVSNNVSNLLKLATRKPAPMEWSYFPFMCVKGLHNKIAMITSFLGKICSKVSKPDILMYPYIVMGFIDSGRRKIMVYDVIQKRYDDRVSELIKTLKIDECLYILSKM